MDLLFKRYASPFLFLDSLIETNSFYYGINKILEEVQEEKWWNMYLATLPLNEKSYEDWKNELKYGSNKNLGHVKELSKNEIETAVKNANSILSNFNPLKSPK